MAHRRRKRLRSEFRDCMMAISSSLQVGYSIENAITEARRELERLLGSHSEMVCELKRMEEKIRINQPIEEGFFEFATRSGLEEIMIFSEVFLTAKRTGGNLVTIMKGTARQLNEKIRMEEEIQTAIAAKVMEEKIMCAAPVGIILYMQLTGPEFLTILYTTTFGRILMSACLLIYLVACFLAARITRIEL